MNALLHTIRQKFRAWQITRIEADMAYAEHYYEAHMRGLSIQLATLRLKQYAEMRAQDIARRMDSGKLA